MVADVFVGWVEPFFDVIAHLFYEVPELAVLRRPSQLTLVRVHLVVLGLLASVGLWLAPRLGRHARWWVAIVTAGYAIRAVIWIAGGNLPLVPGDSSHYVEVATSVYRGEGPVKHYVESFFIEYPAIREGRGTLDDWATPLYAYVLAGAFRVVGVVPGDAVEPTFAVAKGTSFVLNLLCLPALYGLARRVHGREAGLLAMALVAILPVHALYAGFALRESLVALTSIVAVWLLVETWQAAGARGMICAVAAGVAAGLAILARNTAAVLLVTCAVYGLVAVGRSRGPAMGVWATAALATIAPWAWATEQAYGQPFFSYTQFFQYTFSWAVHHYQVGAPTASDFYTWANAPEIARVKGKSLLIISVYSTMILSAPLAVAAAVRVGSSLRGSRTFGQHVDRASMWCLLAFVCATLVNVADVTQVAQLGRYYLPVFVLLLPAAAATLLEWARQIMTLRLRAIAGGTLVALLWASPSWAYDFTWFSKPFQLHLPALRAAGEWMRQHPEVVAPDARVMTWFPWELRLFSQRTTILMPRSFDARRNRQTIGAGPFGYRVTHVLWGSSNRPRTWTPRSSLRISRVCASRRA